MAKVSAKTQKRIHDTLPVHSSGNDAKQPLPTLVHILNSFEEERQLLARQRYLQEKKRMIILDESRAEEQARKEAGLVRIEQVGPRSLYHLLPYRCCSPR